MKALLIVALGGGLGSIGRYLVSGWALQRAASWQFPLGTFLVNVLGCLFVGVVGGLVVKHDFFSAETRLFLFAGIAGGFTTFSAFGLETFHLLRRGDIAMAAAYVSLSILIGMAALWLGFTLAGKSPLH